MKVLHVLHSLEPGGTEQAVCRLARTLDRATCRHVICTLREPRPFQGSMDPGVEVIRLRSGPRKRWLFVRLATLLRHHEFDIVHARNWGTWTDAVMAARLARRAKVILGFHGLQEAAMFSRSQRARSRLLGLARQRATAVSIAAARKLTEEMGFDPHRIEVICNGVDVKRFTPACARRRAAARARLGIDPEVVLVGMVANFFHTIKGHEMLLEAFGKLDHRQNRFHLVLAGYGPRMNQVKAHAARRGIESRVTFPGRVTDVWDLMAALDVYACSSRSEGMSNAVLEAMACGLPCVVTDVSDHQRIFSQIDPRLVVPVNQSVAMAGQLARLADDVQLRTGTGQRCRTVVEQRHTVERMLSDYDRLYARLGGGEPAVEWAGCDSIT